MSDRARLLAQLRDRIASGDRAPTSDRRPLLAQLAARIGLGRPFAIECLPRRPAPAAGPARDTPARRSRSVLLRRPAPRPTGSPAAIEVR